MMMKRDDAADGRGPNDRDAPSSSRSTSSQMGDRSSSMPNVMGASPGTVSPAENVFCTPPTSRTGPAHTGSPSSLATARVSPVPPPSRQPAVPIRPPAFRPVPIQAPGTTGPPSRAQVVRTATAAVRQAAPGQRVTETHSSRPAAMTVRDNNYRNQARPVASPAFKSPPNVRPAAPNPLTRDTYARVATSVATSHHATAQRKEEIRTSPSAQKQFLTDTRKAPKKKNDDER